MGGDHAPVAMVEGAVTAHVEHGLDVVLVGPRGVLTQALRDAGAPVTLAIADAPQVVGMGEDPAVALRAKPGASVRVAALLVAQGQATALVSAGSTGATLAAALLTLGRLPGVRRPVVAAVLPVHRTADSGQGLVSGAGQGTQVILVDAGGSPDVQPEALVASAGLGAAYARVRGVTDPRVGLLNVGAEPGKGNLLARQSHRLLSATPGFVGNVEPDVILRGGVDVIVTDGFTGNVFLKAVEAARSATAVPPGAAVLLGVAGEVLVAHGAARPETITSALMMAAQAAAGRLSVRLAAHLAAPVRIRP